MLDMNTFIERVYSIVVRFCKHNLPTPVRRPGPAPSLDCPTVLTLAILCQLRRFGSERSFYRFAERHLRTRFPQLPHRTQYLRQLKRYDGVLSALAIAVAEDLGARQSSRNRNSASWNASLYAELSVCGTEGTCSAARASTLELGKMRFGGSG